MHDAGAPLWREIVEKSHARLFEELTAAIESDRRKAVEEAVAAEQERAAAAVAAERERAADAIASEQEKRDAAVAAERQKADAALATEREIAKVERESLSSELTAARDKAAAEIAALRESVNAERKARENAEKQLAAELEESGRLLAAEHERGSAELKSEKERASAELKSEKERAAAELKSVREQAAADLKSAREQATAEMTKVSERATANLSASREQASSELARVRAELTESAAKSATAARQTMAEALNQSLRRIRQAASVEATLQLAVELSSAYAHKAVVLVFENNQARVAALRPASAAAQPANGSGPDASTGAFDLTLDNAPALATAIETRDPVTVLARESEISPALARLVEAAPPEKVYLFPVVARQQVVAMLVVAGEVFPAAPELLAEAAGMRLEAITDTVRKTPAVESAVENLVTIQRAAAPSASATAERRLWDELSPEDQKLHLQAQRVARVRVAKMRLEREDAWRRGLAESDVYGALRRDIEAARTEFLQTFLSKSSTMVDYLHLEILRSLANEDDRVLGREYPGPMV